MIVEVWKSPRYLSEDIVLFAVRVASEQLGLPDDLFVEIFFSGKRDTFRGYLLFDAEERHAEIFVYCHQSRTELLKTIFHELAHVLQMLDGRLVARESFRQWNGVLYPAEESSMEKIEYQRLPWEKDAIEAEERIFLEFRREASTLTDERLNWVRLR